MCSISHGWSGHLVLFLFPTPLAAAYPETGAHEMSTSMVDRRMLRHSPGYVSEAYSAPEEPVAPRTSKVPPPYGFIVDPFLEHIMFMV